VRRWGEYAQGGGRLLEHHGLFVVMIGRVQPALAHVDEERFRLNLTGAANVGIRGARLVKRCGAGNDQMAIEDCAVFKREGVEGSSKLVRCQEQRRVETVVMPAIHEGRKGLQVVGREARGKRHGTRRAVRDERHKPLVEHTLQV